MADVAVVRAWTAQEANEAFGAPAAEEEDPSPYTLAGRLLASGDLKKLVSGQPENDFAAVCNHLSTTPNPGIRRALAAAVESRVVSVRNIECDVGSLCALLAVLPASPTLQTLSFWSCSLSPEAIELLKAHLPASVATLGIEVDQPNIKPLMEIPGVKAASFRCCTICAPEAVSLKAALNVNTSLLSLSLFSCSLGDEAASAVIAALRMNSCLLVLNLGANRLTDASAEAILRAMCDHETSHVEEGEEGTDQPIGVPNRTLTALDLSSNRISVAGRRVLEQAMNASEALKKVELRGNPCMRAGPCAGLTHEQRALVAQTWSALDDVEGRKEEVVKTIVLRILEQIPEAASTTMMDIEAPFVESQGLEPLVEEVMKKMDQLVDLLPSPSDLSGALGELGIMAASRALPPVGPFKAFGTVLIESLANALGDAMSEAASAAWHAAYASASDKLQEKYTISEIEEYKKSQQASATSEAQNPDHDDSDS